MRVRKKYIIACISDTEKAYPELVLFSNEITQLFNRSDYAIHLGDGINNFNRAFYLKKIRDLHYTIGNNDNQKSGKYKLKQELYLNGKKIFFYHGQSFNPIREHVDVLINKIKMFFDKEVNLNWYYDNQLKNIEGKYDIVIHGHTHIPRIQKIKRTIFFCPGSFSFKNKKSGNPPTLGLVDLLPNGKMKFTIRSFNKRGRKTVVRDILKKTYVSS